jgi:hypothetical protein
MGSMLMIASGPASSGEDAGEGVGSGSLGFSGLVSGVWVPTVLRGRRRVPLLGFGSRPRESQTML